MTTYTAADVNAWYQAIDNLPSSASLPAGELAVYVASLNSGHLSPTQVQSAIENSAFTRNIVDKVIREYVAAYGGVPTQAALESYVSYASKSAAHLANLPAVLANSAAFAAAYGAGVNAHTIVGDALATALYTNAFGAAPPASWLASHKGLTVAVVLNQIANSAAFISDTSVAIAAFQNAEITGTEQTSGPLDLVGKTFVLTTGVDTVNGGYKNVAADLTPYNYNGKGPTLNVGDSISNVTNLIVTDQFGEGNDVIPSGVNLSNITNVDLTTQGVAGGGNSDSGAAFDVSGVTGLKTVNVVSYGGNFGQASSSGPAIESGDWVKAAATTAISVTQNNTGNVGVWTLGGSTVAVVDNGTPEYPAGVNDFNAGVNVGSLYTPGANPTGAVTVTEYGNNAVFVFGGSAAAGSNAVTVDTAGYGQVLVGDWEISTQSPSTNVTSGNISVTDTDTRNAPAGPIGVFGGQDVTVASTPQLGGDVIVGTLASGGGNTSLSFNAATNQQFVATGDVSVTNEAAIGDELNYQSGQTSGVAGATVVVGGANITVTTDTGAVAVGAPILVSTGGGGFTGAGLHSGGIAGQLDLANLGDYLEELFNGTTPVTGPGGAALVTGAVNITDTANDVSGGQFNGVYVFGGVGTSTTPAVTINNAGTQVVVGADAGRSSDFTLTGNEVVAPTGAVVVNDGTSTLAPNQAYDNIANTTHHHIDIVGATITNVTVTTNAGGVTVGDADVTPDINVAEPTGNVSVTDSAGAINPNSTTNAGAGDSGGDEVNVYGASGTGSFVKVVATDGDVNVGTDDALPFTNPNGAVNVMVAAIRRGRSSATLSMCTAETASRSRRRARKKSPRVRRPRQWPAR